MEYEIKVQDLIEHIRFGTQMKYDIKDYVVAIEGLLDLYNKEKEKNKKCEYYEMVADELYKNSISKDKIREKIEELNSIYQQEIKQKYNGRYYHQLSYAIQILQKLL